MPARCPPVSFTIEKLLRELGKRLRAQRKRLGISATVAAEAAQMSRVTLHRIEKGEPSVAMGAYLSAISSLGLKLELLDAVKRTPEEPSSVLPEKIRLADYPQLKALAWQLKSSHKISPKEAFNIYERNWRHLDLKSMDIQERTFLESLLAAFGKGRLLV